MRPNVLFLTPRLPYPLVGGDRVKAYHLLRLLAEKYDVTCVSFMEGMPARREWIDAITNLGVDLHTITLSPAAAIARVARTILSEKPLEVQYYSHPKFSDTVVELAKKRTFDLVIAFFVRTAEYALLVPNVPRILVAEDARIILQERATAHPSLRPGYFMRSIERRKLLRYEPRILDAFDLTTYVSAVDRARMTQLNPGARTAIVTNGVDLDAFPFTADQAQRHGIVFAGKMDVMHNVRMAERIGKEIFPLLRAKYPGLTCTIVGQNPAPSIRRMAGDGIVVTGEVPHVRENVSNAAVFMHPQIIGAGIQNKVLEAMALGTPVVTTPVGISGIAAQHGVHAMIGTTSQELAAAAETLLRDAALRETIARNARRLIEEQHTWSVVGRQLDDAIARVLGSRHDAPTMSKPAEAAIHA